MSGTQTVFYLPQFNLKNPPLILSFQTRPLMEEIQEQKSLF
jgi:hypothetical protein